MIDRAALLKDLKPQVKALEKDLLEQTAAQTELGSQLRQEYAEARSAGRTGWSDKQWIDDRIAQAAVAWILACVFVRFLEDNHLIELPAIAGPGARMRDAVDAKDAHFRTHPGDSDSNYLLAIFDQIAEYPATEAVFDRRHNALWQIPISGDAARELIGFFRRIDPDRDNALAHDFTDEALDTRFLGDLYQDLSEHAKKTYALLQTPEFVEEFILERTLDPAIEEFGLEDVTMIDPTCGSGHFLIGSYERLLGRWRAQEPGTNVRELVQRSLHAVHGIDLNPFAVAIAKFRLMIAAIRDCGISKLADSPRFELNLAVGDSLLHGHTISVLDLGAAGAAYGSEHFYETEDAETARSILNARYHAVVGNPPYITPKDPALNEAYRQRFATCYREYALSAPFMERFWSLAVEASPVSGAGFVGKITSNSFMRREFGRAVVEDLFPQLDLTGIVDTSGAYIPGHGTPTVVLFGRNRPPSASTVRAVLGVRGEPSTPRDPASGLVWTSIVENFDRPGAEQRFVEVRDAPRQLFNSHPWSLDGGPAPVLKSAIESASTASTLLHDAGVVARTSADPAFILPSKTPTMRLSTMTRLAISGDQVRDWNVSANDAAWFPYLHGALATEDEVRTSAAFQGWLWPLRTFLWSRATFGKSTYRAEGRTWWEWHQVTHSRVADPGHAVRLITWAEVATHTHFAPLESDSIATQTAPVIKLPEDATEDDYVGLVGILNSSTACFWLKQVAMDKGGGGIGGGLATEMWEHFFQFASTKVAGLPLPEQRPLETSRMLDKLASERSERLPRALAMNAAPHRGDLAAARDDASRLRKRQIALQEELDWLVYDLYGLLDASPVCPDLKDVPEVALGERAFEIVLARLVEAGEEETQWFARHGSTPITEVPERWPAWYREIVQRRIEIIESNREIALIERPECKRRWLEESWDKQQERALRTWLLDRLESESVWSGTRVLSCARLAGLVSQDAEFRQVAELWVGDDIDLDQVIEQLVVDESIPFVAQLRYTESGLRTREVWERTWDLQRAEDEIDARTELDVDDADFLTPDQAAAEKRRQVGDIAKPPPYKQADFHKSSYWKLRGKLDVPKERFILYPHLSAEEDPSTLVGWAGWNHLQRAQALAALLTDRERSAAWESDRFVPILAGLRELLPWLRQWHGEVDPEHGQSPADAYAGLLESKLAVHGLTEQDLIDWRPPAPTKGRKRMKAQA